MQIDTGFIKALVFVCLPIIVDAVELTDVQISETEFLVSNEDVFATDIYLNTTEAGLRQTFDQLGGSVVAEQIRIDNGFYQMMGGELNASRIALGDPTSDRFTAFNTGQQLELRPDQPISLYRLDLQSIDGLFAPVPTLAI